MTTKPKKTSAPSSNEERDMQPDLAIETELRNQTANLICEDKDDQRYLNSLTKMNPGQWSKGQRTWVERIIQRGGAAFIP